MQTSSCSKDAVQQGSWQRWHLRDPLLVLELLEGALDDVLHVVP